MTVDDIRSCQASMTVMIDVRCLAALQLKEQLHTFLWKMHGKKL